MTTEPTVKRWQDRIDLAIATMTDRREAMFQEIAELRAQVAQYKEDAERLHYVLRRLPGSIIRALIGVMSDTGDIHEFRAAIDKARKTT